MCHERISRLNLDGHESDEAYCKNFLVAYLANYKYYLIGCLVA